MKKLNNNDNNNNNEGENVEDANVDCSCCLIERNRANGQHKIANCDHNEIEGNNNDEDNKNNDGNEEDEDDDEEENSSESLAVFEAILRKYDGDDSIQLHGIVCEPGSRLGDNYMSVVKRVFVHGTYAQNQGKWKWRRKNRTITVIFFMILLTKMH